MINTAEEFHVKHMEDELNFAALPGFAGYLLQNKLTELAEENLRLAVQMDIPVLKYYNIEKFSHEQLVQQSIATVKEFLQFAIENRLAVQIEQRVKKWMNNELPNITKDQLVVEDITLANYLRKNSLYKFIPSYTSDVNLCMQLVKEIDRYTLKAESAAFNGYIVIHQEKLESTRQQLEKYRDKLLEAQEISKLGSFEWDITGSGNPEFTPQVYKILETDQITSFSDFLKNVHPDDEKKLRQAIEEAISTGCDYECEYRHIRNGKEKVIWSRGIVETRNGIAVRMKGTIIDITDRKDILENLARLNQTLAQKNKELKRSNDELTSFSYAASHDLQEPLRKIKTFCNILSNIEHERLSLEGKDFLGRIDTSVVRMQNLIDDLLAFSRTQFYVDAIQVVDMNGIMKNIRNTYEHLILLGQLKIDIPDLPNILGVPFQLQQLFDNVVSNSVKYRKPGEMAEIKINYEIVNGGSVINAAPDTDYLKISISDKGIGFDQKYSEKIFEIFQRLHGRSEYSGTGIGLAICKRIVENHKGFIFAKGHSGEGATFDVYLPYKTT